MSTELLPFPTSIPKINKQKKKPTTQKIKQRNKKVPFFIFGSESKSKILFVYI
jgi:hypothetical protein